MSYKLNPFTGKLDDAVTLVGSGSVAAAQDGTAALPGISFANDLNTGIYRPGADQLALSTNGTGRLFVDASGVITTDAGITSSRFNIVNPNSVSTYDRLLAIRNGSLTTAFLGLGLDSFYIASASGSPIVFCTNSDGGVTGTSVPTNERMRITSAGELKHIGGGSEGSPAVYFAGSAPSNSLVIDSSGRVGLATSSPNAPLHVKYADTTTSGLIAGLKLQQGNATNGNRLSLVFSTLDNYTVAGVNGVIEYHSGVEANTVGRLEFYTKASGGPVTERMRITSGGDFYFNTTVSTKTSEGFRVENNGQPNISRGTGGTFIQFFGAASGTAIGSIVNAGGTATTYNTSSDYRLKENVTPVTDGITRLQQLKPSRFNFIADPGTVVDGFLAHEVQTVVPEAITGEKDAVDDEGNPVYQGIDQSKLVPLLTAALQEAIGRIETLEAEVAALKAS